MVNCGGTDTTYTLRKLDFRRKFCIEENLLKVDNVSREKNGKIKILRRSRLNFIRKYVFDIVPYFHLLDVPIDFSINVSYGVIYAKTRQILKNCRKTNRGERSHTHVYVPVREKKSNFIFLR